MSIPSFRRRNILPPCLGISSLTPWRRVLLENLISAQLLENSWPFMESECLLACSQQAATDPCSQPVTPVHTINPRSILSRLSTHLRLGLSSILFPLCLPLSADLTHTKWGGAKCWSCWCNLRRAPVYACTANNSKCFMLWRDACLLIWTGPIN
jgi:hypothetical protein